VPVSMMVALKVRRSTIAEAGVGEGLGPAIRGVVFGHEVVAAAMIDRLVHHADVIALKGDSYRLKDRDLGRVPTAAADES